MRLHRASDRAKSLLTPRACALAGYGLGRAPLHGEPSHEIASSSSAAGGHRRQPLAQCRRSLQAHSRQRQRPALKVPPARPPPQPRLPAPPPMRPTPTSPPPQTPPSRPTPMSPSLKWRAQLTQRAHHLQGCSAQRPPRPVVAWGPVRLPAPWSGPVGLPPGACVHGVCSWALIVVSTASTKAVGSPSQPPTPAPPNFA